VLGDAEGALERLVIHAGNERRSEGGVTWLPWNALDSHAWTS